LNEPREEKGKPKEDFKQRKKRANRGKEGERKGTSIGREEDIKQRKRGNGGRSRSKKI